MLTDPNAEDVAALLAEIGLRSEFRSISLRGGGNNRVYRVEVDGRCLLVKSYFRHADDPRDRIGAEFSFSRFAWDHGLRCLAQPLACNRERGLALYEFIEGRTLLAEEVGMPEVRQAIDFHRELNRHRTDPHARDLPNGSEACFTLDEHLACVERRIARLLEMESASPLDREASRLVQEELGPIWKRVRDRATSDAAKFGLPMALRIPVEDERLSPSDFGFHNAILANDGRLRFIDFEYAGWDDPAKTACDFVCQPSLPAPAECFEELAEAMVFGVADPQFHLRRISLLLPVYRVKWCCLMLNDFLPVGSRRRAFAQDAEGQEDRKRAQLAKAASALHRI